MHFDDAPICQREELQHGDAIIAGGRSWMRESRRDDGDGEFHG